jgi:hypothetical protein
MAANRNLLQAALHKPYDRLLFAKEVLSPVFQTGLNLSAAPVPASAQPNKSEQAVIHTIAIYGTITLDDGTEIICYEITLQPTVRIEQSKVAIQRYVRKLLVAGQAALVNFVAPQNKNVWRLTLVAKDSELTEQGVKEKITHAKRYTYLLGPSETCKTAAERFEALSIEKQINFQALVNAFSVEKLSKVFFDEYTRHYQKFCTYLQESNFRKSVFKIFIPTKATQEEKDRLCKPIRDFVKKNLGRIVFLYFVQKKGWLGASNIDYKDGLTDFIKKLFTQSGGNDSFYPSWLSVLFFDTLNRERDNDDFKMPDGKKVKVPFLNGGLFDKEEYDETVLTIPAKLFHNADFEDAMLTEKNGSSARGFLDFLDAFNFTVHEDSPDDHTVAVDPEMLGHIFENLLEDNKDKGAFYTPKEIVHYMCQESLTEYLITQLNISDEKVKSDVDYLVKRKEISDATKPLLKQINEKLDTVKICDPAIGSGAFPMGLLQEIHAIKEVIAFESGQPWRPAEVKETIIQNSIYGVDIEKGAVDIARLRFWLSLVVDEEKPRALPNLDYKIVVGDSLVSKFEGEIIEIDWDKKSSVGKADAYVKNVQQLLKDIAEKQRQFFKPDNKNKKKLHAEIRDLKLELLINQLSYNKAAYQNKTPVLGGFAPSAKEIKHNTERDLTVKGFDKNILKLRRLKENKEESFEHFDWKLDFPEVLNPLLKENGGLKSTIGFDIVIGNPPYIKEYTNREAFDGFRDSPYYQGKMDIWYGFACKMIDLLKHDGVECFIAQNNWITSAGASIFREKVLSESEIKLFTDFGNYKVFESAGIQTMVYVLKRITPRESYYVKYSVLQNDQISKSQLAEFLSFDSKNTYASKYLFELRPKSIQGKTFTFNDDTASSVLEKTKQQGNFYLTEKEVAQGIVFPQDFVNKKSKELLNDTVEVGEGIFALTQAELKNLKLEASERKIIKPYYTTDDIKRYYGNPKNKLWIIYTGSEFKAPKAMKPYPNLKKHLDRFKDVITSDNKPYGLHRAREEKFFKGESIIALRKCPNKPSFTYTDFDSYVSATFYVIKTSRVDMKYLVALLNSKLMAYWLKHKGKMQGNNYQIDKEPLLNIPLIAPHDTTEFIHYVDKILSSKEVDIDVDVSDLERKIDNLVYQLFNLTEDEVKLIESSI